MASGESTSRNGSAGSQPCTRNRRRVQRAWSSHETGHNSNASNTYVFLRGDKVRTFPCYRNDGLSIDSSCSTNLVLNNGFGIQMPYILCRVGYINCLLQKVKCTAKATTDLTGDYYIAKAQLEEATGFPCFLIAQSPTALQVNCNAILPLQPPPSHLIAHLSRSCSLPRQ